jgi:hypothetical protein
MLSVYTCKLCIIKRNIFHLSEIFQMIYDLWDEIKLILPLEKPDKTIGRLVVPFRKVIDGIFYIYIF